AGAALRALAYRRTSGDLPTLEAPPSTRPRGPQERLPMNRQLVHATGFILAIGSATSAAAQAVAVETSVLLPVGASGFADFGREVRAEGPRAVVGVPFMGGVAL